MAMSGGPSRIPLRYPPQSEAGAPPGSTTHHPAVLHFPAMPAHPFYFASFWFSPRTGGGEASA